MVQFHKLAAIGLAVTLSSVGNIFALGLGEVTWKSSLNQPLDAEIAVYDAHNVTNKELVVKIASAEEFQKAGIERPFVLSDLVFTPVLKGNGKGIIKITSKQPIKEPYLDFLLSVSWASGQTLREYTLLIDPPAYTPPAAVPVKKTVKTADKPVKKTVTPKQQTPKQAIPAPSGHGKTVKAFRGSSLWLLAERSRSGASVQQAMLAIYEANPDAFIDGKMSLLKEGAILRIPAGDQMRKKTRAEAESQVLANVTGKVSTTAPRQVLADKTNQLPVNNVAVTDQLKIAGVSEGNNKGIDPKNTDDISPTSLRNKIAQAAEDLDATRSKNNELRSRMSDLQSRLADMKKLIELKNDQLASLEADIGNNQQSSVTKPVAHDASSTDQNEVAGQAPAIQQETADNHEKKADQNVVVGQGMITDHNSVQPNTNANTQPASMPAETNNNEESPQPLH